MCTKCTLECTRTNTDPTQQSAEQTGTTTTASFTRWQMCGHLVNCVLNTNVSIRPIRGALAILLLYVFGVQRANSTYAYGYVGPHYIRQLLNSTPKWSKSTSKYRLGLSVARASTPEIYEIIVSGSLCIIWYRFRKQLIEKLLMRRVL